MLISLYAGGALFNTYGQKGSEQKPAAGKAAAGMTITCLVVGTGLDNRNPLGVSDTVPASTEKVFCFLDAKNIAEDTTVTFVWILNGKESLNRSDAQERS